MVGLSLVLSIFCSVFYGIANYYASKLEDDNDACWRTFLLITFIPFVNCVFLYRMLKADFIRDIFTLHLAYEISLKIKEEYALAQERGEHIMNILAYGKPSVEIKIPYVLGRFIIQDDFEDKITNHIYSCYEGNVKNFENNTITIELLVEDENSEVN